MPLPKKEFVSEETRGFQKKHSKKWSEKKRWDKMNKFTIVNIQKRHVANKKDTLRITRLDAEFHGIKTPESLQLPKYLFSYF